MVIRNLHLYHRLCVSSPSDAPVRTMLIATSITRTSMTSLRLRSSADGSGHDGEHFGAMLLFTFNLERHPSRETHSAPPVLCAVSRVPKSFSYPSTSYNFRWGRAVRVTTNI
jgi:hypothetical protein